MREIINNKIQKIWGIILIVTGISFFLRIPYIITRIEEARQFSDRIIYVKFCLYFVGIFLLIGGAKKLSTLTLKQDISRTTPESEH